jgi:hypothetical protein
MTVSNVIDELLETLVFGDPRRRYHQPPRGVLTVDFQDPASTSSADVTRFETGYFPSTPPSRSIRRREDVSESFVDADSEARSWDVPVGDFAGVARQLDCTQFGAIKE